MEVHMQIQQQMQMDIKYSVQNGQQFILMIVQMKVI